MIDDPATTLALRDAVAQLAVLGVAADVVWGVRPVLPGDVCDVHPGVVIGDGRTYTVLESVVRDPAGRADWVAIVAAHARGARA